MIIFKIITPKSESDSNYEEFEYLLEWYGTIGAYYQYMFTDREINIKIRADVISRSEADYIKANIMSRENSVTVIAEDLSLQDMKTISSILQAPRINRVFKDGTRERVAIEPQTWKYRQTDGRYNLEFEIIHHDSKVAN